MCVCMSTYVRMHVDKHVCVFECECVYVSNRERSHRERQAHVRL